MVLIVVRLTAELSATLCHYCLSLTFPGTNSTEFYTRTWYICFCVWNDWRSQRCIQSSSAFTRSESWWQSNCKGLCHRQWFHKGSLRSMLICFARTSAGCSNTGKIPVLICHGKHASLIVSALCHLMTEKTHTYSSLTYVMWKFFLERGEGQRPWISE